MMHVVKRWQIDLSFNIYPEKKKVTIYIDDDIWSNMLSKLNEISFPSDPMEVNIKTYEKATYAHTGVTSK